MTDIGWHPPPAAAGLMGCIWLSPRPLLLGCGWHPPPAATGLQGCGWQVDFGLWPIVYEVLRDSDPRRCFATVALHIVSTLALPGACSSSLSTLAPPARAVAPAAPWHPPARAVAAAARWRPPARAAATAP
eukprot:gene2828-biopygen3581